MALSLLTQKPSFSDLQSFFDPFPLQQFQTASSHFAQFNDECNSMEYNSNHNSSNNNNSNNNYRHYHNQHNFMPQQHYYSNNGSHHKRAEQMHNFDHGSNSSSGSDTQQQQQQTQQQHQQSQGNQPIIHSSRPYMNGYHHQHIGSNYEQVISFVDSPPNSEESWTDEPPTQTQQQTKLGATPGPQIIDVQTLYPNSNSSNGAGAGAGGASNSRKRRMDWDSLDIEPNDDDDSTGSGTTTTAAVATKAGGGCPIAAKQSDKDKNKREKSSGRASWTDEIGFDLNAEYNNNSYLNNEPFLSFSQSINALKQEPQTVDLKASKLPLSSLQAKIDKTITAAVSTQQQQHASEDTAPVAIRNNFKSEVKSGAICSSPLSSPKGYESNINGCVDVNGGSGAAAEGDNYPSRDNGISVILSVLDAKKTESAATAVTPATTTTSLHTDEHKFQYILAAATSIATKNNEETLTYLNQGQSYEIKLKKIGDLSFYRDKILKSVIKICFHERRLQYMEREQMQQWQASRPGERIIEVDVPLSYGLCHVSQPLNPQHLNTVEVFWDPLKEVGVHIKVNCISTEFTPKKHGGEKGVPFRLQIETYIEKTNSTNNSTTAISSGGAAQATTPAASNSSVGNLTPNSKLACLPLVGSKQPVHAAACQIKVFKLKGADRKHKQDREKIQKRPQLEQEKFQPSYECTIMNEISLDSTVTASQGCYSPDYLKTWPNSPVHMPKYDGILAYANHQSPQSAAGAGAAAAAAAVTAAATAAGAVCSSPIAINSVTSTNSPNIKMMEAAAMLSPQHVPAEMDDYVFQLMPDSSTTQVAQWLTHHRLSGYIPTFSQFCGADVMRMSKEDLMQICGLADGIRMYNILKSKAITPRLTFYVSLDGLSYNAIYLLTNTAKELIQKLYKLPGFYEILAKCSATANGLDSGAPGTNLFNAWSMHSKYSGSGSNIFNDVNKSAIYLAGPGGVHVTITDEVLNNEIKDNSLYALDMQNGKIIMKLINKCDN